MFSLILQKRLWTTIVTVYKLMAELEADPFAAMITSKLFP